MPKDKTPKPGPEHSREREWTAVLEDIRGQFRAFGEGLEGMSDRLEKLETDVSEMKSEVSIVKSVVMATRKDLEKFDKRLTALEPAR